MGERELLRAGWREVKSLRERFLFWLDCEQVASYAAFSGLFG